MNYIFRICFYAYIISIIAMHHNINYLSVASILVILIFDILCERYIRSKIMILCQCIFIVIISSYFPEFIVFLSISSYELQQRESSIGLILAVPTILVSNTHDIPVHLLIFFIIYLYGYITSKYSKEKIKYTKLYDNERRTRYELEGTRNRLIKTSMEIEHLAEIKERNRIARDIHDTVGHNIAGIYMQLQAAYKIRNKDREKSDTLISKSIDELSKSLSLLRETVHNIKPKEYIGIDYIKNIIDNFTCCKINFTHSGDFNNAPSNIMQILSSNIKEALTNVLKYSHADTVDIRLEINEKWIRLYIKDNGNGCSNINEGLGISGMRERVKNAGGTISIDSSDGFLIVCVIPIGHLNFFN